MDNFVEILKSTKRIPIFVDLNNTLFRFYYMLDGKSGNDISYGTYSGFANFIKNLDYLGYEIFLCEEGSSKWRKELNEDYKADRLGTVSFRPEYFNIRKLISNIPNAHTLLAEDYEADDVMFSAAKICSKLGIKCCIFTRDRDLFQALDKNIRVVTKISYGVNESVSYPSKEYDKVFSVPPKALPFYRALKGDTSDNIKPVVSRFPTKLMERIALCLSESGSLADFKVMKDSEWKWLKQLKKNWLTYQTNYNIMRLKIIDFKLLDKEKEDSYIEICNIYKLNDFYKYVISR